MCLSLRAGASISIRPRHRPICFASPTNQFCSGCTGSVRSDWETASMQQDLRSSAPVLIAGAGPVGLTLAAVLAWRGVRSLVVEPRVDVNAHPRAISIGVRTMEHFRRLGLDDAIIDAGVP